MTALTCENRDRPRSSPPIKTAPGTKDGLGAYVDGNASFSVYTNSSGYILSGPEYFTIFNGLNGAKLWNTNYNVPRGTVSNWGDSYGNRVDRFIAGVAAVVIEFAFVG